MILHCPGQPGHGSLLLDNTAGEKVRKILDKFYEFREQERKKLDDPNVTIGDVTTVNLTIMEVSTSFHLIHCVSYKIYFLGRSSKQRNTSRIHTCH